MTTAAHRTIAAASIALVTGIAFLPALQCGFIWDDNAHVTRPELRSLTGLGRIWFDVGATQQFYPLLHSAFWLEQSLWGELAWPYHLVNVLEHAGAACLIYLILRRLLIPGAYLVALLFAVHPVQVESVVWITEQKNTLSALFYLGALLVYLQFDNSRLPKLYIFAALLFVLGLLTKTVTATLPAALLVIIWRQRGAISWRNDVRPLLPWFALGVIAGLTTAWVERTLVGAEGAAFDLNLVQRFLLAGRVIWFYIETLVWPGNLIFIYPRWHIDASIWWQWLFPAAAIVVTIGLWLLRHRCRGPLAAWLFFVGTLFPVLGFFNVYPFIYSFAADHFQYLASLGPIVLFAAGAAVFFSRTTPLARYAGIAIATVLVAALSALTWRQTQIYADNVILFEHTLQSNPDCWMAYNNLGFELLQKGDITGAVDHFRQSLRLDPNNSAAQVNMGLAAERLGNIAEAIRWYELAIKNRPDYFFAHNALGHALMLTGHSEQAIPHYTQAIALRADYAPSHCNLATALAQLSHNEQAIAEYKIALQLQPDYPDAHHNLAFLLATAGQLDQAVEHYRAALHQRPNFPEAHFNWANAIAHDQPQAAIEHYQAAIRLRPDYTEAYANLAATCAQIGDRVGAVAAMQKAVELAETQHNDSLTRQLQPLLKSYQTQ